MIILYCLCAYIYFCQAKEGRIVGGQIAHPGQFPYQVSFRNAFDKHICGGSILNKNWILTAASSIDQSIPQNIHIVVGSILLNEGGTHHKLKQIKLHPKYNNVTLENDVAVVETVNEIIFNDLVQPIALLDTQVKTGQVLLSGWGRLSTNGNIPKNLMYLMTEIFPQEECALKITINNDTLCTFAGIHKGSCFGDTGSALVVPGKGQIGINSFVVGGCGNGKCAKVYKRSQILKSIISGYPDGYSSIFVHRSWILSNT